MFGELLGDLLDGAPVLTDPAELERLAVISTAPIRDPDLPHEVRQAFVEALEARGDQASETLLVAAAALAPTIRAETGSALARLGHAGLQPTLPEGFGKLQGVEARRGALPDGSELYMVRMQRPEDERSQIASVIVDGEGELAGTLAMGMISDPLEPTAASSLLELERDSPDRPDLEPLAVEKVGRVLREAGARMRELAIPASGELALSLPLLGQAICGDPGALGQVPIAPPGSELFVDPEDAESFDGVQEYLLGEFGAWVERADAGETLRRSGDLVAGAMLHWKWGYADGRLGHWTTDDLKEFFLDYAPRALPSDDELIGDAPECAAGLLRFLDEVDLLAGEAVERLTARCDELRAEWTEAARDKSRWGPAKALVAQMEAEGVDPTDEDAVEAWMEDFNSRPREQRGRVFGPAVDRQLALGLTGDPDAPVPVEIGGAVAPEDGGGMSFAVGWFPAGDYEVARERWDELGEMWREIPHSEYCCRMEATFRGWAARGLRPTLVPLRLVDYLSWCEVREEDPAEARSGYAADMLRLNRADCWPPGPDQPCWCGSGRKYRKCCGAVTVSALHPLDAAV